MTQLIPTEVPVNTVPPISLDRFLGITGLARSTVYLFEKRGWLKTHVLSNRRFVLAEDVVEFNRRLKAGEFACEVMPNPHARGGCISTSGDNGNR